MADDVVSLLKDLRTADDYQETMRQKLLSLAAHKPNRKKSDLEVYADLTKNDPELAAIAMIESSGGKNLKHEMDPKSGMTAGGMFGMMPYTASDVVRLDKNLANKYSDIADLAKDYKTNHSKITEFFNTNPEAAAEFAKSHYNRAKTRLQDPNKTAYSWFQGISGALRASPEQIDKHDYVQKFKKYYKPTKIAKD